MLLDVLEQIGQIMGGNDKAIIYHSNFAIASRVGRNSEIGHYRANVKIISMF